MLHNGLIVIVPSTHRLAQCHLFRAPWTTWHNSKTS